MWLIFYSAVSVHPSYSLDGTIISCLHENYAASMWSSTTTASFLLILYQSFLPFNYVSRNLQVDTMRGTNLNQKSKTGNTNCTGRHTRSTFPESRGLERTSSINCWSDTTQACRSMYRLARWDGAVWFFCLACVSRCWDVSRTATYALTWISPYPNPRVLRA